ncbi:MAG TPA: glycosyltransferase [Falsiroseomonas sp.]|jgi:GT2 family glycosyltransferase|nr:glycosyltransferase [Falsiroseomonas sp.]
MTPPETNDPVVTLVVTPREKWSVCRRSLDSILQHTEKPYRLVWVDGGSPAAVRREIAAEAARHGFELVRTPHYLTPNEARLIGLERVRTRYVVFIDNDVIVSPGWLGPLIDCAEKTGAAVVSPVICQGHPVHEIVHCAGGTCGVKQVVSEDGPERHIFEHIASQGRRIADLRRRLSRSETGLAEFHCLLARTEIAQRDGMIDRHILNTREHVDFCLNVTEAGGTIWLEPDSIVTYLHDTPLRRSDLAYFMLRWSDAWERRSIEHVIAKRGLTTRGTIGRRLNNAGWRRRQYLVGPFVDRVTAKVPVGRLRWPAKALMMRGEAALNALLTRAHAWKAGEAPPAGPPPEGGGAAPSAR